MFEDPIGEIADITPRRASGWVYDTSMSDGVRTMSDAYPKRTSYYSPVVGSCRSHMNTDSDLKERIADRRESLERIAAGDSPTAYIAETLLTAIDENTNT